MLKRTETLFGSWTAALLQAGIDPPVGAFSPWLHADKTAILAEIRRRRRGGEALQSKKIERERWGKPLTRRGRGLFGSWDAALLAAIHSAGR